jgi:hypothetical protein
MKSYKKILFNLQLLQVGGADSIPSASTILNGKSPNDPGAFLFENKKILRFLLLTTMSSNGMTNDDGSDKNK